MKTAIIYVSKHGTTEKIAHQIQQGLGLETELIDLKNNAHIDLSPFDQIIIGGSIHAGMIQNSIKDFYNKNAVSLLEKRLGLFISCFYEGEIAQKQLEKAYPEVLKKHAISIKVMGGEMLIDKMNFFEKLIVKKVVGITQTDSKIKIENIQEFINEMRNS
ncbi:MAG: flavodoxin [Bacteroidetes bacterium]|nr:flavodoxin [Bacteroidota bacterium]